MESSVDFPFSPTQTGVESVISTSGCRDVGLGGKRWGLEGVPKGSPERPREEDRGRLGGTGPVPDGVGCRRGTPTGVTTSGGRT